MFGLATASTARSGGAVAAANMAPAPAKPQTAKTETANAGQSAVPAGESGLQRLQAIGSAVWLMSQTVGHKHLFLADIEWLVTPPISAGQFRLWHKSGLPIAYASWAYLSDEVAQRLQSGIRKLAPAEWKCGDQLWLMDVIAPFGGQDTIVKDLRERVLKGKSVKTLQAGKDGKGFRVVEW